jgi:hypothetical protein
MGTITRTLPVKLTEAEIQQKANALAEKVDEQAVVKTLAKGAAADYKKRLEDLTADASALSRQIRSRSEDRPVECIESPDYHRGMMDISRIDTGEVVDSRQLSYEERQQELPRVARSGRAPAGAKSDDRAG